MKTIILFPIVLIFSLYIVLGLAIPEFREARQEQTVSKEKETQLSDLEKQLSEVKNFIGQIDANAAEVSFLNTYIPKDSDEHELVNMLSRIASRHGVAIQELSVTADSSTNNFEENTASGSTNASITIDGEFVQIMAFLADTARANRVYDFVAGTIANAEDQSDEFGRSENELNQMTSNVQFRFAHINHIPQISANDFKDHLSFDSVRALQEVIKTVDPITLTGAEKQNPFKP